jgi:hypothetical protein
MAQDGRAAGGTTAGKGAGRLGAPGVVASQECLSKRLLYLQGMICGVGELATIEDGRPLTASRGWPTGKTRVRAREMGSDHPARSGPSPWYASAARRMSMPQSSPQARHSAPYQK